jgi:hypothetical protein
VSEGKYVYWATYWGPGDELEMGDVLLKKGLPTEVTYTQYTDLGIREDVERERVDAKELPAPEEGGEGEAAVIPNGKDK